MSAKEKMQLFVKPLRFVGELVRSRHAGARGRELNLLVEDIWTGKDRIENDLESFRIYHDLKKDNNTTRFVDGKTWSDLNMDDVFNELNRTSSTIGSQYLYHNSTGPMSLTVFFDRRIIPIARNA
ncbi:MAG: hypothetical protein KOO63_15280 [Bacteroidales bacterium]|nr:hypothetical protein [Candidatus Latescibacterota bacterium]